MDTIAIFVVAAAAAGLASLVLNIVALYRLAIRRLSRDIERLQQQVEERGQELRTATLDELERGAQAEAATPKTRPSELVDTAETQQLEYLSRAIELLRDGRDKGALDYLLASFKPDMHEDAKAELHLLIAKSYRRLSLHAEAEGHYNQALLAARGAQSAEAQSAALTGLGLVAWRRGDLNKAVDYHMKAMDIDEGTGDRAAQEVDLGNLGVVYTDLADLNTAQEYLNKALSLAQDLGDEDSEAADSADLARVYALKGELDKAENLYEKALSFYEKTGNRFNQVEALGGLGWIYAERGDLHKAEERLNEALTIASEIGHRHSEAALLANLGGTYRRLGDLRKAEQHYKWALAINEEIGNRLGQALNLASLGTLAMGRGQIRRARGLLRRSEELYTSTGAGGENPRTVAQALRALEARVERKPRKGKA
ncbi:MAG: tetratricopeptide repeat protein [Chloroflexi bacterium]|nr:tetratricopeptide repeat protein [Chloroflexota bacterium]